MKVRQTPSNISLACDYNIQNKCFEVFVIDSEDKLLGVISTPSLCHLLEEEIYYLKDSTFTFVSLSPVYQTYFAE